MRSILVIGLFLCIFQCVLSAYGPWEDLKRHYEKFSFDKAGVEERQRGFEESCSKLTNSSDGVCYDDCMFRTSYKLLRLEEELFVTIRTEIPLFRFENDILQLQNDFAITNEDLNRQVATCALKEWDGLEIAHLRAAYHGLVPYPSVDLLCLTFMSDSELQKLEQMLECIKLKLKQD